MLTSSSYETAASSRAGSHQVRYLLKDIISRPAWQPPSVTAAIRACGKKVGSGSPIAVPLVAYTMD